jgi:hypothetical protein
MINKVYSNLQHSKHAIQQMTSPAIMADAFEETGNVTKWMIVMITVMKLDAVSIDLSK